MSYVPTGFPRGRPRKGELRPQTYGAKKQAEWRAKQKAANDLYLLEQALYQQFWRLENIEKRRAQARAYYYRRKSWAAHTGLPKVSV